MRQIDREYAAHILIEIMYEKGLVNKATYENIQKKFKPQEAARKENAA